MSTVLIYADKGVDGEALRQLVRTLQECDKRVLKRVDAQFLLNEPWEETASLLIIPGGRDVFYHAALDGAGTDKIRKFVENGGTYLGICAGAYFACSAIEFEKGTAMEVCAPRSLKFFPGIAKGSAYGPNKYFFESTQAAEAAKISWEKGECHIYFNAGCTFESQENFPHVRVLSRYLDLSGHPAAILEIDIGKGKAILSGVHFEYSPKNLRKEDPRLAALYPILLKSEEMRQNLMRTLLQS
jgi:glutamine amidotransferase-like uncharacterized protein